MYVFAWKLSYPVEETICSSVRKQRALCQITAFLIYYRLTIRSLHSDPISYLYTVPSLRNFTPSVNHRGILDESHPVFKRFSLFILGGNSKRLNVKTHSIMPYFNGLDKRRSVETRDFCLNQVQNGTSMTLSDENK